MEREQHYQQWLATQVYLDAIWNADIENTGESGIPPKEKRPQYGGMPKEWRAAKRQKRQEQCNATAGPSRLAKRCDDHDKSNHNRKEKESSERGRPPHCKAYELRSL
jgi:hypothetical protein